MNFRNIVAGVAACLCVATVQAKLPAPSDEAKAKSAEAAAKAAHGNKVAAYQLCKSMDNTAAIYYKTMKAAGKETKPPVETPACVDPGPYVAAAPATAASAPAPASTAAAPAAKPAAATSAATPAKKS